MNAKIILAAFAAVCCLQGIAAASLGQPQTLEFKLEDLDEDQMVELIIQTLTEENILAVNGQQNMINFVGCIQALANNIRLLVEVKDLYDKFGQAKAEFEKAKKLCSSLENFKLTATECNSEAEVTYKKANKELQSQLVPLFVKASKTLFTLKNCVV